MTRLNFFRCECLVLLLLAGLLRAEDAKPEGKGKASEKPAKSLTQQLESAKKKSRPNRNTRCDTNSRPMN